MAKIVLDTNFLLVPFQIRVDVFREAERLVEERTEFIVLSPCAEELKSTAAGGGRDARAAKAALSALNKLPLKTVKATGPADDAIKNYAAKENAVVCTNDKKLRKELKEKGIKVIALRSGSHLAFA